MEVTWRDVDLLDGDGRLTTAGAALLRDETSDERLAIVTLLGAHSTASARRRVVAEMLLGQSESGHANERSGPGAGVTLLASVSYSERDYRVLVLDVGDPSSPVIGALCGLSSLVLSACDTDTAVANALPAFPPFHEMVQALQREMSSIELYDMLPTMVTVDFSHDASLAAAASSSVSSSPSSFLSSLAELMRLKTLGLRPAHTFTGATFVDQNARVKKVFGTELTGDALLALLHSLARDAADGHDPDLSSAWDEFVELKCTAVAEDALATYVDCIQSSLGGDDAPPIEIEAFEKLHDELWRLALDVFHSGAGNLKAPSRRAVKYKLKTDLSAKCAGELQQLRQQSRQFCERLRLQLWQEISTPLLESAAATAATVSTTGSEPETTIRTSSSVSSFRAALEAIQRFDSEYNDRARGPEKTAVLCAFHQHEAVAIYRTLESVVTQQMTREHLQELRERLELDFATKKAALVAHFKQEEAQLRVCMAREMEMLQKLNSAKNSRSKIDDRESKRLREQAAESRETNATLARQQIVLEHAAQHATQRNQALETTVRDLEHAVRQEMASRAELVDTLAATIKAAEAKERQLQDQIAALQIEVHEKASRIENELRELTVQLRKTSEEKDELQKKLNEFFLRVTALPAAVQQHLFCTDGVDQNKEVGFVDALSSFMNA